MSSHTQTVSVHTTTQTPKHMAAKTHSTNRPLVLEKETVARVAANHRAIVAECATSETREHTGNARYAVTKPATIPPWGPR